jgi:hypothetical protein
MSWPFVTRRRYKRDIAREQRVRTLMLRRASREHSYALEAIAAELSRAKDTVALHIVAAGHPDTVVHDVTAFAESLREALAANRVDIRLELARMEGGVL